MSYDIISLRYIQCGTTIENKSVMYEYYTAEQYALNQQNVNNIYVY